ncbi:MAG TPA: iron-sulfur cluster assembly scaffold protein [Steroidobacteraceae bacterium]|nr:iron-sulfur cluster assembly scaffold protein [Steroidobacteraceae bacterium]
MKAAIDAPAYPSLVLEHFREPRGVGRLEAEAGVFECRVGERRLGAEVELGIKLGSGVIERAAFRAFGCPYLIAAASELVEQIAGRPISVLEAWSWRDQADRLGVPAERFGRLLLVEDAVKACLTLVAATGGQGTDRSARCP